MTLRGKLLLAQGPLAVALVLLGVTTELATGALGERSGRILRDNYRSVLAAQRVREAVAGIDAAALRLSLGGAGAPAEIVRARATVDEELAAAEGNITEAGEAAAAADLRGSWSSAHAALDEYLAAPAPRAALALSPALAAVAERADAVQRINQAAMVRRSAQARATARRVERLVLAVTLVALALGLLFSMMLTARVLRPLAALSDAVRRLGAGDLGARAAVGAPDEIGGLAADFNAMAERLERYRRSSLGELLLAQRHAQAVIDSFPDPVVVLGTAGEVLATNEAAEQRLQIRLEAGRDPLAGAEPAVLEVLARLRAHVADSGAPWLPHGLDQTIRVPGPDGELALLPRATPLLSDEGHVAGVTVVLQEVTRLIRLDQLKDDLVATVAHEVRTPLTSLRMATHLLAEQAVGPLTEKQADLVYAARDDCVRLQAIVDDLLDVSRIQAGRMELAPRRVAADRLVAEAVEAHRAAAAERGLSLRGDVESGAGDALADPDRIQLVLANFLVNAIRHTPPGGQIVVRAAAAGPQLHFEVADTGGGIAAEHREALFERFFRVPGTPGSGAGLGLFIAREVVRAHGGEIGFDSEVGRGTTFWFRIAAAERAGPAGHAH